MKRFPLVLSLVLSSVFCFSQDSKLAAQRWADSVFKTLSSDEKIAQLMIVRLSAIDLATRKVTFYTQEVESAIKKFNIGGICLFQGGPLRQAQILNYFQTIAKTPILVSIDAENGVGMRFDSVAGLPRQMMMGAVQDPSLIYQYGRVVGEQCKRMGIHVNYAPVVDVNNNPENPVINDRSFGEDKFKVALFGIQYMKGLQDVGVMASAKHFPGHGDVSVDSHVDLPVIPKSRAELDSMELYPFRQLIAAGVGSVMVAHLSIPSIDNTKNRPSSLSIQNVTKLLRNQLGHKGLTFTDALEMRAVRNYFPDGEASVQSLIAGNDMLCLPGDVSESIARIKEAIKKRKLSWKNIDQHVKRVLIAKYQYGLANTKPIELRNLTEDLNKDVPFMRSQIARNAITVLRNEDPAIFPLAKGKRIAYIGFGLTKDNNFAKQLRDEYDAHVYYFDHKLTEASVQPQLDLLKGRYDVVIAGLHGYSRVPTNNFGLSAPSLQLLKRLQAEHRLITMVFGNPYAIKNFCDNKILVACYDDDALTHEAASDLLNGRFLAKGKLPVTVCEEYKYGAGIISDRLLQAVRPADLGFQPDKLLTIDSVVNDAIRQRAIPGAVVLVAKDGKIAYEKAFGHLTYDSTEAVYPETIYDLASVTKIMATTLSVMKLHEEKKLPLDSTLGSFLPWVRGTNKENLTVRDILLHQAGLQAWIPFYRETIDSLNMNLADARYYTPSADSLHTVRVAENMYLRNDWVDTMYKRILESKVGATYTYVYSDNDFIFLGKIVESLSGMALNEYVEKTFYEPLGLRNTTFLPRKKFAITNIAPTEKESGFRNQLLRGDVHDPGAAMFGGVAGHAGLFGTAYDLAVLSQMLLNGGTYNGHRFFETETINYFTSYHATSRRGLGFDKPERDNDMRKDPYPTLSASPLTFGHTGFTGTCVWIDPKDNVVFVFLSNRVHNNGDSSRFLKMSIRPKVHEIIYQSLNPPSPTVQMNRPVGSIN
jgi:beta-N-acetylhexosaminidase